MSGPERIWASVWKAARRGKHTMGGYTNSPIYPGSEEYTRADLHAAAIARAERAEAALAVAEEGLRFADETFRDLGWHAKWQVTTTALAKIAALKGGAE